MSVELECDRNCEEKGTRREEVRIAVMKMTGIAGKGIVIWWKNMYALDKETYHIFKYFTYRQ